MRTYFRRRRRKISDSRLVGEPQDETVAGRSNRNAFHFQHDQQQDAVETPENKYLSCTALPMQTDDVVPKGSSSGGPTMVLSKHKANPILQSHITALEKSGCSSLNSSKDHLDPKALPKFDQYVVEEEEGSGSYGTVYRARRKSDGVKFAIKYPHPNVNKHHVDNERKMLQRFGGKNFVIQYEGSCTSEDSDCFVLKHVEHDQPDVLKMEIDIHQLRWYGYCMFTALASLHKLGVVHRDVKPGNFLFSRKTCIGYMIDFNLAKDLHRNKNTGNSVSCHPKSGAEHGRGGSAKGFNSKSMESMMLRHKVSVARKGGGDGSELREPLPCHGRKELINLAHEAMRKNPKQNNNNVAKRIGASPALEKQGPCPGTKGFRAPEVLLRSLYQGPKLDVWSAGVTLLYLITGNLPLTGEPEQNIKEIVKLRGSEQVWEIAKLHDCESSFPAELYDAQFLQSMELNDWCKANTWRPDFLKQIPTSFIDLLDKCLVVNPRLRISAEDALKHDFFVPCFNAIRERPEGFPCV